MPSDIAQLPGVGPNAPPAVYGQVSFAQGSGSLGNSVYSTLILANAGSGAPASTAVLYGPDTQVTLQSTQDAINLFLAGSPAQRMFSDYIGVNPGQKLYVMVVPTATGTAASATITVVAAGSPTQTTGTIVVTVGTTQVTTVFGSTDNATTIALNMTNAINGTANLNVTASPAAGVVTLTAKVVGARGNWIRFGAQVTTGSGVTVNGSTYTGRAFLTSGAGSDDAGYTTCINALVAAGLRFYTVISEAGGDVVDGYANGIILNLQENLIDFEAQPLIGIRQTLICGSVDTLANTVNVATSLNDPRCQIVTCKNLDVVPGELASLYAAAVNELSTPFLTAAGVNFDGLGATPNTQSLWQVPAPLDGSAPSRADIQTAVVSGVTILRVGAANTTSVVKACTTHFWTVASTNFDPRIVDAGKVTICDYFLDDVESALVLRYQGKLIGNDPTSGVVGAGVVTPSMVKNTILEVIQTYGAAGLIDPVSTAAALVVQRGSNPTSRMEVQIPLFTSDPLHSFTVLVLQVS